MTNRRVSRIFAAALAAVLLLGPGWFGSLGRNEVQAQTQRYWWSVVNERGEVYPQGAVTCSVHPHNIVSEGTHVFATMGSPGSGTTSPLISNAQGVFEFFWTSGSASFDVVCYARNGGSTREKMTGNTGVHQLMIARSGPNKVSRFAFHSVGNQGQTGTDVVIPQGGVVRDVIVNVTSWGRGTSQHINIGFAGNHAVSTMDALASGLNLSSHGVGWIRPHSIANLGTAGSVLAGNHRGGALSRYHQSVCFGGVCSGVTTAGGISFYLEIPYLVHVAGGLQVTYQISGNPDTIAGHAYILWQQLHVGADRWSTAE